MSHLPKYKFDINSRIALGKYLPHDYYKAAMSNMDFQHFSQSYVSLIARGKRYNDEIHEALSWLALETLLTKILTS